MPPQPLARLRYSIVFCGCVRNQDCHHTGTPIDEPRDLAEHWWSIALSSRVARRLIVAARCWPPPRCRAARRRRAIPPPAPPSSRPTIRSNPLNRKTFELNLFSTKFFFRPVPKTYVTVVPDDGRRAIHHMLDT